MIRSASETIKEFKRIGVGKSHLSVILTKPNQVELYRKESAVTEVKTLIMPEMTVLKKLDTREKIVLDDKFEKLPKNADYGMDIDQFFSDDHIYYKENDYTGFSDYSIIGKDYVPSGFAPFAVAIHIVYFAKDGTLWIRHFVSDSNDDREDPAGKFGEAVSKLAKWYNGQPHP